MTNGNGVSFLYRRNEADSDAFHAQMFIEKCLEHPLFKRILLKEKQVELNKNSEYEKRLAGSKTSVIYLISLLRNTASQRRKQFKKSIDLFEVLL
ncbi:hypothetical protein [Alkalicoccus luteus]|uniref:hypothetical protein n=1 Tax=Alkalicoccus luteus TaxID=1237094 RepID=UPI004033BA3B